MRSLFARTPSVSGPLLWTALVLQVVEAVLADSDWGGNLQALDFGLKPTAPVEENKHRCEHSSSPNPASFYPGVEIIITTSNSRKLPKLISAKNCHAEGQKLRSHHRINALTVRGSSKTAAVTSLDPKYSYRQGTRNTISDPVDQRRDPRLSSWVRGGHIHSPCHTLSCLRLPATAPELAPLQSCSQSTFRLRCLQTDKPN